MKLLLISSFFKFLDNLVSFLITYNLYTQLTLGLCSSTLKIHIIGKCHSHLKLRLRLQPEFNSTTLQHGSCVTNASEFHALYFPLDRERLSQAKEGSDMFCVVLTIDTNLQEW